MTHQEIMALWYKHGGSVHGPRVETVTMPEEDFWSFVEAVLAARAEGSTAPLVEALKTIRDLAPTMEPILRKLCPDGCLPTSWAERQASVLAAPFAIATTALAVFEETVERNA